MLTFTTNEAKQNFDKLADTALTQPISITQQGRVILEIMTPQDKEKMVLERAKQFLFDQFVADAVDAHAHYQATGLHTTHDAMKAWVDSLSQNPNNAPPICKRA